MAGLGIELKAGGVYRPPGNWPRVVSFRKLTLTAAAPLAATEICATTFCPEGLYRASFSLVVTGECPVGSVTPRLHFTDTVNDRIVSLLSTPLLYQHYAFTQGEYVFYVSGVAPVQFSSTTVGCNPVETLGYAEMNMTIERLY
jgi:hypothetical protein